MKCVGATERVVHDGSAAETRGGPLRMEDASAMDWESRRSCAARNCGEEVGASDAAAAVRGGFDVAVPFSDGYE